MPGTPVIYYGDEIGMGDNVYLRDRDGVRTPMQWSPDRNGGFSRADPAALVLPSIQDALYGFQAVNVESQLRDGHSLLNWTRRMLAVRKRTRAFGRGAMRLLYPGNRKVLAYLREWEEVAPEARGAEAVLCVFNLSRTAQAVELDLSALEGRVPVEMLGGTPFPPIGALPYLLTLPPYAFHWFLLAPQGAALPAWHQPAPEPLPELRTLVARAGADWLPAEARALLEREVLPAWLPRRRWFDAGEGAARTARIASAARLEGPQGTLLLTEVETQRPGAAPDRWLLPLARIGEEEAARPAGQLALARLRQGSRVGLLTDAAATDGFALGALAACREGRRIPAGEGGEIACLGSAALAALDLPEAPEVRRPAVEHANTAIILGEAVVLKLYRRVLPGPHPEAEMARHLSALGYGGTPPLLGEVRRGEQTLMLLEGFVRNQGDAWVWTLDWLARTVDEAALTEAEPEDRLAGYLPLAEAMGRRLAELHLLLARPSDDPAFAPEEVTAEETQGWADAAAREVARALELLARPAMLADAGLAGAAQDLAGQAGLAEAIRRLAPAPAGLLRTRRHGDFHLGQVLVTPGDAMILDFEGEAGLSPALRRAKGSPWQDVAGLLCSLDYAAALATATEASGAATAAPTPRRAELIAGWRAEARMAFLDAYRAAWSAEAGPMPAGFDAALALFELAKSAADVLRDAAERPAWLPVPAATLLTLARGRRDEMQPGGGSFTLT
jgi:maltose alpha-D-glucosyltransferase/alpha-amylase